MAEVLHHRGPDGEGVWVEQETLLAHRRLAVVGLGDGGRQPMHSASGRCVLVFNGEIYNYAEIRERLKPHSILWQGESDTEVFLEAIEAWGVEGALERAVGMFAFAVWDRVAQRLTLARDRVGEKPLYFANLGGAFAFSSELSGLRAVCPGALSEIDDEGLDDLLRYGCTRGSRTILSEVQKLPPASFLSVDPEHLDQVGKPCRYWVLPRVAGRPRQRDLSDLAAINQVDRVVTDAVERQMVADVPLGAFLSGGVDSSLVVAKMVEAAVGPVRTFSIGFESPDFDEAPFARAIAEELGTTHTEHYVSDEELLALVPTLPFVGGEPFADPSLLPTLIVCALAREHVTVALSGDGADELFAGYNRYPLSMRLEGIPAFLRRGAGTAVGIVDRLAPRAGVEFRRRGARSPGQHKWDLTSSKFRLLRQSLVGVSREERYHGLLRAPSSLHATRGVVTTGAHDPEIWGEMSQLDAMLLDDLQGYLVDDILTKVDRAAMHVSLETRMPFLDHRVVEAAWSLPHQMLIRGGRRKWVLREILKQYLPPSLTDRPKAGFGVPLATWLREPLRPWAEDLLVQHRLDEYGLLHSSAVRRLWSEHVQLGIDRSRELWPVLMLQGWMRGQHLQSRQHP